MQHKCGLIILALGHPYYGRMAYNLAMSLKAIDRNINITLAYNDSAITHINKRNMWVFDNQIMTNDCQKPFGIKCELDLITPYERTIYIDADTLWTNKQGPSFLFEQLKGISFTGITEGVHRFDDKTKCDLSKIYPTWADVDELRDFYKLTNPIFYQWRSEFIYFENNELTNRLFAHMRKVYERADELKSIKRFAQHIPDELAINVATNQCNINPHKYKWQPTYWDRMHGGNMIDIADLQSNYYAISCGSNAGTGALKRTYDRLAAAYAGRLGLQHVFPLVNKKEMMINRQLM